MSEIPLYGLPLSVPQAQLPCMQAVSPGLHNLLDRGTWEGKGEGGEEPCGLRGSAFRGIIARQGALETLLLASIAPPSPVGVWG